MTEPAQRLLDHLFSWMLWVVAGFWALVFVVTVLTTLLGGNSLAETALFGCVSALLALLSLAGARRFRRRL